MAKTPKEKIKQIKKLSDKGMLPKEISEKTGVYYWTVKAYLTAHRKKFESYSAYQKHLSKERQKNPKYKYLSELIKKRLEELDKPLKWLALELNISYSRTLTYLHGKTLPNRELQGKMFEKLELPYKTLDDLMREYILTA